jgi:hypothetical protein
MLLPAIGTIAQSGSLDIGAILSQLAGGGVGSAIVMIAIALIKNAISKKAQSSHTSHGPGDQHIPGVA